MTYKAVLFTPDGQEWVTDYGDETVAGVWENVESGGSRWFFYPIVAIITDRGPMTLDTQRIVDAPEAFSDMKGHTIRVAARMIAADPEYVAAILSL